MAVKPVKFVSDVETKKQIIKTDISGNVLFAVSGTLPNGSVSSSLPITASGLLIDGNAEIVGTLNARRMHITEITTSVYYEDSLSASINALQDVSASNATVGNILKWDGTNWIASNSISGSFSGSFDGTASYAITAAYALAASGAVLSINDLTDVSASNAISGNVLQWDGTKWVASGGGSAEINARFLNVANLSEVVTGAFDPDGYKDVQLTKYSYADLDYVMINVMVQYNAESTWVNDLLSVELSGNPGANKLHVLINAPDLSNLDKYRIFAHKQTGSL